MWNQQRGTFTNFNIFSPQALEGQKKKTKLDAAAKFIFYQHGAQGDGYPSIIAGGKNTFFGHYY